MSTAAAVALDLAALFTDHTSLPDHMGLRVSAHVGPTFFAEALVLVKTNFYGVHVNKTTRMEPCTPVGSVWGPGPRLSGMLAWRQKAWKNWMRWSKSTLRFSS